MEKKTGRPGSKFRTRLVLSMIGLTLIPAVVLFIFALGLMNRTIDKWFSTPVDVIFQASDEVRLAWAEEQRNRTLGILEHLSQNWPENLDRAIPDLSLDAIVLLETATGVVLDSAGSASDINELTDRALQANAVHAPLMVSGEKHLIGLAPGPDPASQTVAVLTRIDDYLDTFVSRIDAERTTFLDLRLNQVFLRDTYVNIIVLITILVLFAAVWTGLYLSKRITVPIEALSGATRELSAGNLDHRVSAQADDELGVLVGLFNDMAGQLQATSTQLDERRRYTETILESIPTGVVSIDESRRITKINRAARTMFSIEHPEHLTEVFDGDDLDQIHEVLQVCAEEGTCTRELTLSAGDRPIHSAVIASRLTAGGFVLVVEDLTELVRAQTTSAWREVARRLAHEIKNPLTPIQLSAERIVRNAQRSDHIDPKTIAVIRECVEAIIGEVDGLQELVDEFGRVARLPVISRKPTAIKSLIERTLSLYEDRLNGTRVRCRIPDDLPLVSIDAQQIKRVLINLLDNALEAMAGIDEKRLSIDCRLLADRAMVQLSITDNGHGISPEDRDRLFSPYFSTRKDGTGLGLEISSRIVSDHGGYIGAESNGGAGTRFVLELPLCPES
jgi:two-component system nitrogen regulation sensor histidine kinase NtrY